ncbi:MAG: adenylate kinase family protein [archaeon]
MIILFTGTPGTGKSTLAKEFAKKKKWKYIDVNKVIDDNNLIEKYDIERDTFVVDEKRLSKILVEMIKKEENLVIDSHMAHYVPKKYVDLVFCTKCDLRRLKIRLESRKYKDKKVRENLDAEIFDVCLNEAMELGHKVIVLDTTHDSLAKILKLIENAVDKNKR